MKSKSRAVLAAGLGTILSLSVATSAAAAVTGLDIGDGSLGAKGLVATVPITFTCDAGANYEGYVLVRQAAQQKFITQDDEYFSGACTGELQTVNVELQPYPKPFKKATSVASARVLCYGYDPEIGNEYTCGSANVTEEIRLR